MSMLAEPRRKQKVSLNPRGKWWTEDPNKFGQKMLEKMGWTKGKGLGANEQGIAEYSIKSMQKNSTTGIGFDENNEKWTEHHEKFSGILKQLQENQDQDIVQKVQNKDDNSDKQSLELKSKKSCVRVHYHKFTRGKDINKYKSKDLANIFGQEELSDKIQTKIEKEESNEKEITETKDNWHGVVTINGGNMADYFKFKSNYKNMISHFKCKPNNNLSNNITDNQAIESESENEQRVGFGFASDTENTLSSNYGISKDSSKKSKYAFDNPCSKLNTPMETTSTDGPSKKSSKKRKKKLEIDNLCTDEINEHNTRKKLKIETIDGNCAFTNPALDLNSDSKEDCNGKEFEISRSSNCEISKDSRKKSKDAFDNPCLKLNTTMETTSIDDSSKKSSKKKKKKLEIDNLCTDEINEHNIRKKLKIETIDGNCSAFTNPALDLNSDSKEDCNGKEFEISRSSNCGISKDSRKKSKDTFDNPCLKLNNTMETTSTDDSSKKSSKKKKLETDNLCTDEINEHNTRKKLKIKTIDGNCSAFTNPPLDLNSDSKEDCNGKEFEISRSSNCGISKDSRKKSKDTFDNPCLKLNNTMETTSTNDSSKKSSKKKKKKLETDNLCTDEINNHNTGKKLKIEISDSNGSGFTNPTLDLNSDSKEDCNGKEFEISRSSSCGISKDSRKKSKDAFDNPCLKLNTPMETTSTDGPSKKSLKKKKKLETDNLCINEINNHDTGKKLKTEINDSNCGGFTNPALDLNSDSKEDCNGKEFEISRPSNCEILKDSNEKSNYAFDNPCLKLNTPMETTNTNEPSKKKKKKLETDNLYTNEINEHDTGKNLKTQTNDSNCGGFTNSALDLNSDSKEDCNSKEFEIPRSSSCEISKDSNEKSNYAFDNPCLRLNDPMETTSTDGPSKKSSKKKKKKLEPDNFYTDEINKHDTRKKLKTETIDGNCSGFTNPALDLNSDPNEDCNGKEFEISRAQFGLENCALDLTDERCDKKRVTFNDRIMLYEYDKNSIKKKGKKKEKHTLDKFEVENKKHKKKQKCESITSPVSNVFVNKALDVETLSEEINDNKLNEYNDTFPGCKVIGVSNQSVSVTHSPLNANVRMSKKTLITLYHKNAISDFPGSNIYDLKGYGADPEN